ncbi:MAG: C2H2-type zinc finger protein [Dehalococcoidia bacterium]
MAPEDEEAAAPEDVMIRCPHCDAEFETDGELEDHLQREHDESGP